MQGANWASIFRMGYFTVFALETGTVFFEAKAGPYVPVSADERAAWAPAEGDTGVAAYRDHLLACCGAIGNAGWATERLAANDIDAAWRS